MRTQFLLTTTFGVLLTTTALAQSPNGSTSTATTPAQSQTNSPSTTQPSSSPSQTAPAPSANSTAQTQTPSGATNQSSSPSNSTTTQSQAQTNSAPPPAQSSPSTPSQAQTNSAAPANNQAQQSPSSGTSPNTAAQQPSNAAQTSTNVNASVNINDQQRTRISQSITRSNVKPLTNVNFSVSVGTVIPTDVRLEVLPADVVDVIPEYRGYNFVMVRDEIVIVEPTTHKIVTVIKHGSSTATAPAPTQRKVAFTDRDREVVRKHSRAVVEKRTTGSTVRTQVRTGERVPETVEIETFPEEVYRDAPTLREYRYLRHDNRTYIVEPQERRIIEEID